MAIAWEPPGRIRKRDKRRGLIAAIRFATRISLLIIVAAYGSWYLLVNYLPGPLILPPGMTNILHLVVGIHVLIFWLIPLSVAASRMRSVVHSRGVGDKMWGEFIAFDVDADDEDPTVNRLILWKKLPKWSRKSIALPDDPRREALVVRLVGRKLPHVDLHEDAAELRLPEPVLPGWYLPVASAIAVAFGVVFGFGCYWLKSAGWVSADVMTLLTILPVFVHPVWLLGWYARSMDRFARLGPAVKGVSSVIGLVAMLVTLPAAVLFAIFL